LRTTESFPFGSGVEAKFRFSRYLSSATDQVLNAI
jgi:hypothetical protein